MKMDRILSLSVEGNEWESMGERVGDGQIESHAWR